MNRDKSLDIPVWKDYANTVTKYDDRGDKAIGSCEYFEFYEQARNAAAYFSPEILPFMPM